MIGNEMPNRSCSFTALNLPRKRRCATSAKADTITWQPQAAAIATAPAHRAGHKAAPEHSRAGAAMPAILPELMKPTPPLRGASSVAALLQLVVIGGALSGCASSSPKPSPATSDHAF